MKKIKLAKGVLKLHNTPQKKIIDKAIKLANEYCNGIITARKLSNGIYSVLEVSRNERIVIDEKGQLHFMSHEKYNQFINER